jgi:hypothetical protein
MASSAASKNSRMPRMKNTTPKAVSPMPISGGRKRAAHARKRRRNERTATCEASVREARVEVCVRVFCVVCCHALLLSLRRIMAACAPRAARRAAAAAAAGGGRGEDRRTLRAP